MASSAVRKAHDGVPTHSASSALDLGDIGRIHAEAASELFLRERYRRRYVVLGRSLTSWMRLPSGRNRAVIVA